MAAKGLTERQKLFCLEYIKDFNGNRAAIAAGYSAKTARGQAYDLLTRPHIQAEVQRLSAKRAKKLEVSAEWVLRKLVKNHSRASQAVEVLDKKGRPTGEFRYEGAVVNKALELIGRHLGMFLDKTELTGKDGGPLAVQVYLPDNGRTDHDSNATDQAAEGPPGTIPQQPG